MSSSSDSCFLVMGQAKVLYLVAIESSLEIEDIRLKIRDRNAPQQCISRGDVSSAVI